jgi:gas vesicle protein
MREINQIVAKKEYRRKLGLETGVYKEFKGNTHWNLFLSIQLAEAITKRMNDDLRNIFIQNAHGFNTETTYLNNLSQELKKVEFNINNATTLSGNNIMKTLKTEAATLSKISTQLLKVSKKLEAKSNALETQIDDVSNQINEKLSEGFQATQKAIIDEIAVLKEIDTEKFNDLSSQFTENTSTLKNDLSEIHERVINFQEANNNMIDDQTKTLIQEFQEGIGGLMKQNLDNIENLIKHNDDIKNQVASKIDDSKNDLNSVLDATNEHLDKANQNINETIKQTELQFNKELKSEISDVRGILSTIRGDIELMKSVLTKLDNKIH